MASILSISLANTSHSLQIYGHRGARGLSPENTIPAYRTALSLGVNYVDMDINMTKDGVLVVTHNLGLDPNITRDSEGHWITKPILIKDLTLKQLQSYDVGKIKPGTKYAKLFPTQWPVAGTHIPTLKQVIEYTKEIAGNNVAFQIEIKTDPTKPKATFSPKILAKALAKVIDEEEIEDRVEVQAFDFRCLIELQKINPEIKTAYLTDADIDKAMRSSDPKIAGLWSAGYLLKDYDNSIPKMVKALGGSLWDPQDTELTKKSLMQAHELGLKVVTWSWPGQTGMEFDGTLTDKLIGWGVDGIITDRPDMLRGLMAARRLKLAGDYPLN